MTCFSGEKCSMTERRLSVAYVLRSVPPYVLRELEELAKTETCSPLCVTPSDCKGSNWWQSITGQPRLDREPLSLAFYGLLTCGVMELLRRALPVLIRIGLRHPLRLSSSLRRALEEGCFRHLCAGAMIADRLREEKVDLLHVHFAKQTAHVTMWAAALLNLPLTVTTHARDIFVPRNEQRLLRVLEAADSIATISEYNAAYLEEKLGRSVRNKTRVIRLGVNPSELPAREAPGEGEVCIASGLAEKKGVHVLLEAARLLRIRGRRISCTVVGSDPDDSRLARYRKALEDSELSAMVSFPGALPHEKTMDLLTSASLCVMPSVKARDGDMDGIPVCLMEAAAMGVPIVSTRLSGIPELVVHGETGLLAEPGDPESLADSLQWAADHPVDMERMAARGRDRAARMFDSAASARAVLSMMEEVAGRRLR